MYRLFPGQFLYASWVHLLLTPVVSTGTADTLDATMRDDGLLGSNFRNVLGSGSFDTQDSKVLLRFLSRMCASFPSHVRHRTERSDEAGVHGLKTA